MAVASLVSSNWTFWRVMFVLSRDWLQFERRFAAQGVKDDGCSTVASTSDTEWSTERALQERTLWDHHRPVPRSIGRLFDAVRRAGRMQCTWLGAGSPRRFLR